MSVSCWAQPLREPTLRPPPLYDTRGPQPGTRPRSVPTDLFLFPVSSERFYWKNDESSSSEPPFLSFCSLPAEAVRYDQPLASLPFCNFAPSWHEVTCFRLPLTSCQVGRKWICIRQIIKDNLSLFSVVSLLLRNVGQLVPHFQRWASLKCAPTWRCFIATDFFKMCANLAHIFAFDPAR